MTELRVLRTSNSGVRRRRGYRELRGHARFTIPRHPCDPRRQSPRNLLCFDRGRCGVALCVFERHRYRFDRAPRPLQDERLREGKRGAIRDRCGILIPARKERVDISTQRNVLDFGSRLDFEIEFHARDAPRRCVAGQQEIQPG